MSNLHPPRSVAIVPLSGDQLASAGHVFASSHADYPSWRAVFHDRRQRERALPRVLPGDGARRPSFGAVDAAVTNGQVLGIAVWLPPGRFPWSASRKLRAAPAMLSMLRAAPGRFSMFARLGANAQRFHPTYPHWNLETLGIRQEAQGRGIGTRLMAPGLARADHAGLPCYLTTARQENLGFYERGQAAVRRPRRQSRTPNGLVRAVSCPRRT